MAAYDYIALDNRGKEKKGVIEGDTARQVRQMLRDRELTPLEISESRKAATQSSNKPSPEVCRMRRQGSGGGLLLRVGDELSALFWRELG